MTPPDPYAAILATAMAHFRRETESATKPRLTLITQNERDSSVTTSNDEAAAPAAAPAPHPLHKHGAFDDMHAHLEFIQLAGDALRGIGAMLQPETHDQQLNMTHSSDASAIFRFFGEALQGPASEAYNAKERLESAAQGINL